MDMLGYSGLEFAGELDDEQVYKGDEKDEVVVDEVDVNLVFDCKGGKIDS